MKPSFALGLLSLSLACGAGRDAAEGGTGPAPAAADGAATNVFELAASEPNPEIEALRAAVHARPEDPEAQRRLGVALKDAMQRQEALEHFLKAVELAPADTRYRLDLAAAYTSLARFSEAEAIYRELLPIPQLRPSVLHNLGNLALRKDDLAAAIDDYEQALTLRPDYLLARYHLAVALQQTGRYEESYASFKRVLDLEIPEEPVQRSVYYDAVYRLGELDLARGNPARAAEILTQLLHYYPDHPNAWYGLGRALMILGREEEARQAFENHMRMPDRRSGRLGYLGSPWLADAAGAAGRAQALFFVDATGGAGIDYVNVCGEPPGRKNWITETLGAGAAWLDYDGDGALDMYLVNGSAHDRPAGTGEPNRLYRGDGRGRFTEVTAAAGVGDRGWGHGVAVGDYDNDGDPDLYVTNYGPNTLYRNNGDGTFTDVTADAGVGDPRWGTSAAFFDYDGDGDLDLYVANYLDCDPATVPRPGESTLCGFKGVPTLCGPKPLPPQQDVLYRNDAGGKFADVTREAGVWLDEPLYALGVVTGDYDNDGDPDVYVANDSVPNLLWQNQGDGTFIDVGLISMSSVGLEGRAQSGMGTDLGDYDGDGLLDLVVTNFSDDLNTIYRNVGGRYFLDDSSTIGMSVTNSALSWGVGFRDFDNDGDLDLFVANGHIYPEMDAYDFGTTYRQANHLFVNENGRLILRSAEAGPGFEVVRSFRGAAFGDYDDDGDVDVLVTAIDDPALLLRNDGTEAGHWLEIELVGTRSNRDAVGARVELVAAGWTWVRERIGGGSYLSASDGRLHVGLGTAGIVERISVRWPSGVRQVVTGIQVDRRITIVESE